jgi:pyruvate/2-oxoglutarate dehydrogenase complex dihydrolipoamide dehydrogenase (E3) component
VGCVPSKRLIHLSRDPARRSDPARLLAAVRATRDGLAAREESEIAGSAAIRLVRGRARLGAGRRVTVSGPDGTRTLTARHVVIATGSRPRPLAIPGLPPERTLTNENLFELAGAPEHLAIVGAGPIGVEMACAFARLGSAVTLVDLASRVLPQAEREASEVVAEALAEPGIDLRLGSRVVGYDAEGLGLELEGPRGVERVSGVDAALIAVGRLPNVEGFEGVVATGPRGIAVDGWGRTSAEGVWAVGDVTPTAHQTHAANAHGRRIVQRFLY